jgi:mannitol/fructose-specific phosphotransferase system IIA component (Ntr-type)
LVYYVAGGVTSVSPARFEPFFTSDWRTFFAVTGMVFISYGGLTKVVDVSEEVRDPGRNLPLGMFLAFGVVNVLYVAVIFVTAGVLDGADLAGNLAPIAMGAEATLGTAGKVVLGVAAFLAYATTGNAGILAASRSPMAMSRDGLVPEFFSRTSGRFGTPYVSIILTAAFMIVVIAFLSVEDLAKTASTMFLISFVLLNVAVIVMRRSRIEGYRPSFRTPLFPFLPVAGIAVYSLLVVDMGLVPLLVTAGFLGAASLWYGLYVRPRIVRESAVVFMARRAISGSIERTGLEDELVSISLERDDIREDRFDQMIRAAPVLDLHGPIDAREFFERVAAELAPRLGLTKEKLAALFTDRERQSSTEIRPGLSIPHVVVEGEGLFQVAIARCSEGILFSELHEPVRTAFALVGSADERNFHLKALVAVAHIVSEEGFAKRWREAEGAGQLRDVVMLSRRHRSP